jgi:hypothetical protein
VFDSVATDWYVLARFEKAKNERKSLKELRKVRILFVCLGSRWLMQIPREFPLELKIR